MAQKKYRKKKATKEAGKRSTKAGKEASKKPAKEGKRSFMPAAKLLKPGSKKKTFPLGNSRRTFPLGNSSRPFPLGNSGKMSPKGTSSAGDSLLGDSSREPDIIVSDPYAVLKFVHMTEKSVRNIELQNSLVFIVNRKFGKPDISKAVVAAFAKDVADVRTLVDQKGRKKAVVRFVDEGAAGDIAVRLGII